MFKFYDKVLLHIIIMLCIFVHTAYCLLFIVKVGLIFLGLHSENKRNQFQCKLNSLQSAWRLVKDKLKDHGIVTIHVMGFLWWVDMKASNLENLLVVNF